MTSMVWIPWPIYFFFVSIIFIALVELIRKTLGMKVPPLRPVASVIVFWLGSYAIFIFYEIFTYRGGTISFIWMQDTLNAVIILSIMGSYWYTVTSEKPLKSLISITFLIMGILSIGYGFVTLPPPPWNGSNPVWTRSVAIYIGFGSLFIIGGLISLFNIWRDKQYRKGLA